MLALLDGNNFYVSCERVFRPSLQGRPPPSLSTGNGSLSNAGLGSRPNCRILRIRTQGTAHVAAGLGYYRLGGV